MKLYGIIGYPLSHSFSQKYFTEKFKQEGIKDCRYESWPIPSINDLKDLLKQNPDLLGFNITIPYKQAVLQYLDDATNIPAGLKACNCIKISNKEMIGYNTDIIGFERSLLSQLKPHHRNALVLGNGGAAEAVKFVLKKLHIPYQLVSRQPHDESILTYADLNEDIITKNKLIINTTPVGTFPGVTECPDIPYQYLTAQHHLFDLIYNPEKTLFLQKGEERGATIQNGYEMLLIQADESWRIWNED